MKYTVILFYKYTRIEDPEELRAEERERCERLGLKGRMIVAHEGINGTYEGTDENIQQYVSELTSDSRFVDTHIKYSKGTGNAFPKLSIKVRPEIVTLRLDNEDFHPADFTAPYLTPEELHAWYENNEDFVVIDMRNDYEHAVGHFDKSVLPELKNFRDLPRLLPKLEHLKDKKVLTVCTGGVRCEKASGYLLKHGFKNVHQLDGGMVSYMEKYPAQNFKGAMYVFDNRVVVDYDGGKHEVIGVCTGCGDKTENYHDCVYYACGNQILRCKKCLEKGNVTCTPACKIKLSLRPVIKEIQELKKKITQI